MISTGSFTPVSSDATLSGSLLATNISAISLEHLKVPVMYLHGDMLTSGMSITNSVIN